MSVALFASIYVSLSVVITYLGLLIYFSNRESDLNRCLSLMAFFGALWSLTQGLRYILTENLSLIPYIIGYVSIALISPTLLTTILLYPIRFKVTKLKYFPYFIFAPQITFIFLILTNNYHNLFFEYYKPLTQYYWTWEAQWGPLAYCFVTVSVAYVFLYFGIIAYELLFVRNITLLDRKLLTFMLELTLIIIIPTLIFHVFRVVVVLEPNPFMVVAVTVAIARSYVFLLKYKFISVDYAKEVASEKLLSYPAGQSYILENRSAAYSLFRELASEVPGLIISIKFPEWIRTNFNIQRTPIIWLTETEHPHSIDPEKLDFEITYFAFDFIRQNPTGVLLIDGISYMCLYNDFNRVFRFVKDIIDLMSDNNGTLIMLEEDINNIEISKRNIILNLFDSRLSIQIPTNGKNWIFLSSQWKDELKDLEKTKTVEIEFNKIEIDSIENLTESILNIIEEYEYIILKNPEYLLRTFDEEHVLKFIKYILDVCCKKYKRVYIYSSENKLYRWLKYFSDGEI